MLILEEALKSKGAIVTCCESGKQAINEIKHTIKKGNRYHLILLDYMMPDLDGLQVAEIVKNELNIENTNIIILSSEIKINLNKDKEKYFDDFIPKPIRRKQLFEAINKVLYRACNINIEPQEEEKTEFQLKNMEQTMEQTGEESTNKTTKILLVEDSEDNQLLVKTFLKPTGHEIITAKDGQQAVDKFKDDSFDLVFMDIQMPVKDGYETTREIKELEADKSLHKTPIIALTAYALESDIKAAIEAGCDAHLSKPIKKDKLISTLEEYL